MEKILVTTDLSANSKAGIRFALQLAMQLKAEVIVLYVAEVTKPTSWSDKHYSRFVAETESEYLPKLKNFVSRLAPDTKFKNVTYKIELGLNVSKTIIASAKKYKASFICMSTRGAGKVKKLFGTNASSVLTTSIIPVIVVPEKHKPSKIETILFACDFARLPLEMKKVNLFADQLKAKTTVIHFDYLLDVPENLKKLKAKSAKFLSRNTNFVFKKLNIDRSLSAHLSEEIRKQKPSIVVMFTKQDRNWYDRLLLPSEASEIAFNPKTPLLTFKKSK